MITVTLLEDARFTLFAALVAIALLFLTRMNGGMWQGIMRPEVVRVEEAIAEGEAAASHPGTPFARWRHMVTAPPDHSAVREVVVVTPYYRVAREAYLKAIRGERLSSDEARVLLDRAVKDYGPFPLGLMLTFSPVPQVLPHPQAITVKDASGKVLTLRGFLRPRGEGEVVELIFDVNGADLRWLDLVIPLDPPQRIKIELKEVK